MPKKRRAAKAEKIPLSDKTRAADERLRESLRKADLSKFDKALTKVVRSSPLPKD